MLLVISASVYAWRKLPVRVLKLASRSRPGTSSQWRATYTGFNKPRDGEVEFGDFAHSHQCRVLHGRVVA